MSFHITVRTNTETNIINNLKVKYADNSESVREAT